VEADCGEILPAGCIQEVLELSGKYRDLFLLVFMLMDASY